MIELEILKEKTLTGAFEMDHSSSI